MSETEDASTEALDAAREEIVRAIHAGHIIPPQPVPLAELPLWVARQKTGG